MTEVVDAADVPVVAEFADMLQVGARNAQNFGLLHALSPIGRPVLVRSFEPAIRNMLDVTAVAMVHALSHLPVICDPSYAAGRRDLVLPLAKAAMGAGADGIIVDVHPYPETALCDGPQALTAPELAELSHAVATIPPLLRG